MTKRERFFVDRNRAAEVQMHYGSWIALTDTCRGLTPEQVRKVYERCGISNAVSAMHRARERSGLPL